MKIIIDFIIKLFSFLFPMQVKATASIPSGPKPKPVEGLFSMDLLGVHDKVLQIFNNPMLMGAFKGKVDIQAAFKLNFPCILETNSDQQFSLALENGGIKLVFHKTYPRLYIEKILSIMTPIDYVLITKDHVEISLVGLPNYYINFK